MKTPKPKTKDGVVYSGDNGRLFCSKCAGSCAKFTGRDLSGQKINPMTAYDNVVWIKHFGRPIACECGCTTFNQITK